MNGKCKKQPEMYSKDVIDEIVDFIDGRYEGMKNLLETPENKRVNTTLEIQLMLEEIEIIKDCVNIIIDQYKSRR